LTKLSRILDALKQRRTRVVEPTPAPEAVEPVAKVDKPAEPARRYMKQAD
jgi:hypothetical protein